MNKKRILWITNLPSPYRVDFFNELGKQIDLTVLFERKSSSERDKSWEDYNFISFKPVFINGFKVGVDKTFSFKIISYLKKNEFDKIIISSYSSPSEIFAAFYLISKKQKYILETDGGFPKNGNGLKERVKRMIISHADKCFSTSKINDDYYLAYGAKKKNIVRYPFTSLYRRDILDNVVTNDMKMKIKNKYNIREKKIVLSIGRFIYGKGFDVLLKSFSKIPNDGSVGLYIIGGNPTEEYKTIIDEYHIKNVHFIDFIPKDKILDYCKMSDVFVLPTRSDAWGLVINEAMACGLPVITTNKCIAGLELIEDDINGYIVDVDDIDCLAQRISTIIFDKINIKGIQYNNIKKIKSYTFENMVNIHVKHL